jgi:hypothetical protein
MPLSDEPIDLSALDPDAVPGAESRFVDAVMARVAARPGRYPLPADPLWGAWSLARPLALAASLTLAAALALSARAARPERVAPGTVAESVGVPPELVAVVTAPVVSGPETRP